MGMYINPGNYGFAAINTKNYVDKTMLIDLVNKSIGSEHPLTCVSRPRRSGKSYAARMLSAYYDISCDSHSLFADKKIASSENYEKHINKYNVVVLDITNFTSKAISERIPLTKVPMMIIKALPDELDGILDSSMQEKDLLSKLEAAVEKNGKKFIFIIDEWDAVIREAKKDQEAQEAYLSLLRRWFKNETFVSTGKLEPQNNSK